MQYKELPDVVQRVHNSLGVIFISIIDHLISKINIKHVL